MTARFSCESYLTSTTVSLDRAEEGHEKKRPDFMGPHYQFYLLLSFDFVLLSYAQNGPALPHRRFFYDRRKFIRIIVTKFVHPAEGYSSSNKTINFMHFSFTDKNSFHSSTLLRKN